MTAPRIQAFAVATGVVVVLGLLMLLFWAVPTSAMSWALLVVLGVPVWLFLEWLGSSVLGAKFFHRLSSPARIAVAVPVVALLMAIAFALTSLVRSAVVAP
jgi:hypothetical protein